MSIRTAPRTAARAVIAAAAAAGLAALTVPAAGAEPAACPIGTPTVSPAFVIEGSSATALVSGCSPYAGTIRWGTATGTATASDFTMTSGWLSVPAGSWTRTVQVPTTEDTTREGNKAFTISVGNGGPGRITLLDDDPGGYSVLGPREWRSGGPGELLVVRSGSVTGSAQVSLASSGATLTSPSSGVVEFVYGTRSRVVRVFDGCPGASDVTARITGASTVTRYGTTQHRIVDGEARTSIPACAA